MTGPRDDKAIGCDEFHALMGELIGGGEDIRNHPHLQTCELHRAFIADLLAIRDAARELFPVVEPPDDLWANIDAAIKAEEPDSDLEEPGSEAHAPKKTTT